MFKSNKMKLISLAFFLFILSFFFITLFGSNYTYKVKVDSNINSVDDLDINIEDKNVLEITDTSISNGYLYLKLKSLNIGKTAIIININDNSFLEMFYVHNFGIITQEYFFGKSSGDFIVPICIFIYFLYLLSILLKKYKKSVIKNMYDYKNITYLGGIIFLSSLLLNAFANIFNYDGLTSSIRNINESARIFSISIFPIAVLVSIYIIISNIKLLKKEGFTWKNMLGILLGVFVIFITIMPDIAYNYFQKSTFINIHNEKGITFYIYQFFETLVFACLTYLECILIATIVLAFKASKYIPKFDKDYIIILGCMIRKDGSLPPLLKGRVDKAIEFSKMQKEKTNKDIIFIPSGGKGNNEIISEAEAMKNYLIEQGIDSKRIIVENKSRNTYENIKYSYGKIKEKKFKIAFSTTNYHVFRTGNIAFNQHIEMEGIGSKTKSYFWINAFIREFVATIYYERKKHVITLFIISICIIIMTLLLYLSNVL